MWFSICSGRVVRLLAVPNVSGLVNYVGNNCKYLHFRSLSLKDIVPVPQAVSNQDLLLQRIKSSQSAHAVLEIVGMHHSLMNSAHVVHSLRALFDFEKSKRSDEENVDFRSPEFITLCKRLKTQARALQLNDIIDALKIVLYIGVPSDSEIVEVLLQLIKHNVNDLSLSHVIFLDFLLDKSSSSPLSHALKIALPIVFDTHLKMKFDDACDSSQLAGMLHYAIINNLSPHSVDFLLEHVRKKADTINVRSARRIAWSLLLQKNLSLLGQQVLPSVLQTVASDIDNVPFVEVNRILAKLSSTYSSVCSYYYHHDYFSACAKYVVQHGCDLKLGARILRKLSHVGHVDLELLDYLGQKITQNPDDLINSQPSVLLSLISGFSKANYVPPNWKFISDIVTQHRICYQQDNLALPWIKILLELASLDCFPVHVIERVFEESFLKRYLAREKNFLDYIQLLNLYQAVVTLMPGYAGVLPTDDVIQKASSLNGENFEDFPLRTALEHGLGGSSYVCTKVYTKLGHFVDHAVVIRKGGFPIAINLNESASARIIIEDFELPSDCKIILILCFRQGSYAINCNRLKGSFALIVRTLEARGYGVIPVSLKAWNELPSHEKIPYIMRAINSTYDAVSAVSVEREEHS